MSSSGSVPEGWYKGIQISDFQDRRDLNWLSSKRLRLLLLTLLLTLLLNLLLTFELAVFQTLAAVPLCTRWYDPHTCDACRFLDIGLAGITNTEVIPLVSDTVLAYTRSINSSRKSTHNVCYVRAYVCAHKQTETWSKIEASMSHLAWEFTTKSRPFCFKVSTSCVFKKRLCASDDINS